MSQVVYVDQGISLYCEEVTPDRTDFKTYYGYPHHFYARLDSIRYEWSDQDPEYLRHREVFTCLVRQTDSFAVEFPEFAHKFFWNHLVTKDRAIHPIVGDSLRTDAFWNDQAQWAIRQGRPLLWISENGAAAIQNELHLNRIFRFNPILFV